jgi:hypothetical protein
VINDQDRRGLLSGFKFKAKLLLDSSEEGRAGVVGSKNIVRGPLQLEIVAIAEVGLINNNAAGNP